MKKTGDFTKRMIAILLSIMLAFGAIPGTALASEIQENTVQEEEAITTYTVTLDANGGYFENEWDDVLGEYIESIEILNKQIPVGETVTTVPVYETDNQKTQAMTFSGWSLERDGEPVSQGDEEYTPVDNCILYAVWEPEDILDNGGETNMQESDQAEGVAEDDFSEKQHDAEDNSDDVENIRDTENHVDETEDNLLEDQEEIEDRPDDSEDIGNTEETDPENSNGEEQSADIIEKGKEASLRTDAAMGVVASETCGDNLTWTLDEEGTLTISGTGIMRDYTYDSRIFNNHTIKNVIIEDGVSNIGNYAFSGCSSLTSVTIPDSVTSIGISAFNYCTSLTSVTIPNSVTSIENSTFVGCKALTSVTIPNSVTSIGISAFQDCTNLTSVTIPNSVTEISTKAFLGCSSLTSMEIPNSVTSIGLSAFEDCSGLTSVIIGNGLNKFDDGMFHGCCSLTSINVVLDNPNFASVDGVLFNKNKTILIKYPYAKNESYTIPDSVTEIGIYAFKNCSILKSMTIPDSVTRISGWAFAGCSNLTGVTIPDSVTKIGSAAFQNCSSLISVTIPDSVTSIESYTFMNCRSLTSVEIPDSVTSIDLEAFYGCGSLTSMTIGNGVKDIDVYVFKGCTHLIVYTQNEYVINYCKSNRISYMVINTSLKTRFIHLQQNELKEYYTYYNGSEMKPGFTVELDGENVSLDRLTYHYEDNDKPGIAKLVIDTLDGNAVKSETKFLILPGKVELTKVKSENPGECTVSFETDAALFDYEVDVQLDGKSIEGYPDVIRDISNGESGSLTSSISKYICPLKENETYKIRVRACLKVDGRTLRGEWNEANAKILAVNLLPANGFKAADCNSMWCTVDFKNEYGSDSKVELTGKGYAELHDAASGELVERILLDKSSANIEIIGGQISFQFSSGTKPRNINEGNSSNCLLEPGHTYYVTISDDAVRYPDHRTMFGGFTAPDRWVQTTVDVSYPPFFNFGEELPDELFKQIFDPICWKKAKKECSGKNGCCYGLCYAVMQWDSDAQMRKATSSGNMADLQADSPIKETTFKKYCQLAHILQSKSSLSSQKTWNRFKYQEIYDAVKDGDPIIIGIRFKNKKGNEEGHAVYPICINPENENEIIVYDSNCPMSQELGNRPSFVHCLKLIKENGKFTGWEYIDHGTTFDNAVNLTYSTPGDIFELNNANDWNILISNWFLSSPDLIRAFSDTLGANGEEQPDEDGLYYYWTNQDDISLSTEGLGENAFVRFSDGYNVLSVIEEGDASIHLDLSAMKASVTPMEDSPLEVSLGYCNYMDHDSNRDIAIQAHVSDSATFSKDDDGWILTGSDPGTVRIQLSSEKDAIINTEETSILSSFGNLELRKNNDILQVYEKSEEDESPAKIVGELKEPVIPHTSIENAQISSIVDKTFTGEQVLQEIVVENNGITLVINEDYRLSYSDNINAGTATVTITGIGNYEGSITKIFKIDPAPISDAVITGISDKTYTGKSITQLPEVQIGSTTLQADTDYTLSYSNNRNPGTADITITGIGNYTGTKTVAFTIKPVGWYKDGGEWYYYKSDGKKLTNGWAKDSIGWYWLGADGKITKSKWVKSGGCWYYLGANGVMTTGWQLVGGRWYYMKPSGVMTTGWQQVSGKWYYMNPSGAMTTGWQKVGGKWYYMNPSGAMTTGWQKVGGKWYYMNPSGVMTIGWQKIGGKWYYMNSSGVMMTGWQKIGGKRYYFNSSGVMATGWQKIGGKRYYFNSSGVWVK